MGSTGTRAVRVTVWHWLVSIRSLPRASLRFAPGAKAHGHRHKQQEEIYVLVTGSAEMKVGDDLIELQPFDAVRVPPHVMRGIRGGPEGAEVIAVGAPNTGPGDGDAPDPNWVWED